MNNVFQFQVVLSTVIKKALLNINLRPIVEYFLNRKITIKFKKMYIWASEYYRLRYVFRNDGGLENRHNFWLARNERKRKNEKNLLPKQGTEKYENHAWIFPWKNLLPKQGRNMKTMPVFFWWWNNIQIKAMEKVADFFLSLQIMQRWRTNTKLNDRYDSTYRNGTKHLAAPTVTARYHIVDQIVTLFSIEENHFSYQNFDLKVIFIALKFT